MMRVAGIAGDTCPAKAVSERLNGGEFPLRAEDHMDLFEVAPAKAYPRFFKDVQEMR